MTAAKKRPVLVTTEHKGVFFGFLNGTYTPADTVVTLTDAQMCVSWSVDVNGVLGLAAGGPSKGCKVTPVVPKITLQAVTAVVDCSDAAVAAWIQQVDGPLRICTANALHGTLEPHRWDGDRWWIVALFEPVQRQDDKLGSLKRLIVEELSG